jgi:hydrogenase maturation factor
MRALDVRAGTAVCVDQEGTRHEIAVDLIESVRREQWLLVHAGVAIAEVDAPAGEAATTGGDR